MASDNKKKASDFRYNTGETRVPWAAVGENYNAEDVMEVIRFMMQGKGEEYEALLEAAEDSIRSSFPPKIAEKNITALHRGYDEIKKGVA